MTPRTSLGDWCTHVPEAHDRARGALSRARGHRVISSGREAELSERLLLFDMTRNDPLHLYCEHTGYWIQT